MFLVASLTHFILLVDAAIARGAAGDAIGYFVRFFGPAVRGRYYDGHSARLVLTTIETVYRQGCAVSRYSLGRACIEAIFTCGEATQVNGS